LGEATKHVLYFTLLSGYGNGIIIKDIADDLHLRQDQPSFGRAKVNGHNKQHYIAMTDDVADDSLLFNTYPASALNNQPFCLFNAVTFQAAHGHPGDVMFLKCRQLFIMRLLNVGLVETYYHFPFLRDKFLNQSFILRIKTRKGGDQQRQVYFAYNLASPRNAFFSKLSGIINASGVIYINRPDAFYLHGLSHGVGGGAGNVGYNRNALAGKGIDKRGFAYIAFAENTDVQSVCNGC